MLMTFGLRLRRINIESFEKLQNSKLSKKDSENKFSDTFNSNGVEVFDAISSGIEIPDSFNFKEVEDFGNSNYPKSSINNLLELNLMGDNNPSLYLKAEYPCH